MALADLVAQFAREENLPETSASAEMIDDCLAMESPPFEALIAERSGEAVGYLAFYRTFSLFKPGPVLLVENLFVRADARGLGLASRLLAHAAAEATARGWTRMELVVKPENADAMATYRAAGFHAPGMIVQRVQDASLAALARRAQTG